MGSGHRSGFSRLMQRTSRCISEDTGGRPGRECHRQNSWPSEAVSLAANTTFGSKRTQQNRTPYQSSQKTTPRKHRML